MSMSAAGECRSCGRPHASAEQRAETRMLSARWLVTGIEDPREVTLWASLCFAHVNTCDCCNRRRWASETYIQIARHIFAEYVGDVPLVSARRAAANAYYRTVFFYEDSEIS